jgi:hypothetical protein
VVSLSSMELAGGSGAAQLAWLRGDLARYRGTCTIAFTHYPRFSAGPQYNTPGLEPLWAALSGHGVAFVSGHAHNYQRLWPDRGITQFVAGTGGARIGAVDRFDPRLAAGRQRLGALRLRLGFARAGYAFITPTGDRLDAGKLDCIPHVPARGRIRFIRPRPGVAYRSLRTIRGRTRNARLPISLALVQRIGKRCRAYSGRAFRRSSCRTKRSFRVHGLARWRFTLPRAQRSLPPARYRLTGRIVGLDGRTRIATVRFRVRKR